MDVQMFGLAKSQSTRKAQRFFSERRIPVHFVDLGKRALSPGELRKWVQRFGAQELLDSSSTAYKNAGLAYVSASGDDWIDRMIADPTVLKLPLARCGKDLTYGADPAGWDRLAAAAASS
ncbi:MAG TPA: ArsC/Spx/MgsR family protein [Egibacteraceae bacterium]|nr:ArsC/Spx/MgsR family protein [Egibacteraceae bacterium]